MKPTDPPRPTGLLELMDSLDGMLLLARGRVGTPAQIEPVQIQAGPLAILVFSNLETLARFRAEFPELGEGRIVKIDDTAAFFSEIPEEICVALDLRKTERGTVKYFDLSEMR